MGMLLPFVYINIILIVVRHTLAKHINIYISETTSSYVFSIKHHAKLNGEQCFNMQDKIAPFYISSHTCHLRLIDGHFLDYEKRQRYDILVGIRERRFVNTLELQVHVIDVNDEAPQFVPFWPRYPQAIAKAVLTNESNTLPGTRVFSCGATDADSNAVLQFLWTPGSESATGGRFYIAPTCGVITTVGAQPFPPNHVYRLSIRVVDINSAIPESSFADMLLLVYTAFQPVIFPAPIFTVNVSEQLPANTKVGYIPARSLNSIDDLVTFTVLRGPEPATAPVLIVDGGYGLMTTVRLYDYEKILDHSWSYLISARVQTGFTATALMVVTLVDMDDNPPYFDLVEYQTPLILETVPINTIVFEITPGDLDTAPQTRRYVYTISGEGAASFSVSPTPEGAAQIRTTAQLRFDNLPFGRPFYEFTLTATAPMGSANTIVRVMIQNVNVNPPEIIPLPPIRLFRQQIQRTQPFAQVAATDADGGKVNFFFFDSNTNRPVSDLGPFRIEQGTGLLYMMREAQLMNYTLPVQASDDGSCTGCPAPGAILESNVVDFFVEVVDRNLMAPTFTTCPPRLSLLELASAGTVIGKVAATDNDNNELATVLLKYTLIPNTVFANPALYLQVDISSGEIKSAKPLMRSSDQFGGVLPDQLYFTVRVYDWGVPVLHSLCNFHLDIVDINNHPPQFDPPAYRAVVQRNFDFAQFPTKPIIRVVAVDLDKEDTDNSKIIFTLEPPTLASFSIDPQTGDISVTRTLINESYTFAVMAKNPTPLVGTQRNWEMASITVLTSTNPSMLPPTIQTFAAVPAFPENASNMAVAQIEANPWPGSSYDYSITHVPGAFEQTGWLNSPPPFTSDVIYTANKPTLVIYSGSNFLYQRLRRYWVRVRACRQPTDPKFGDICSDLVLNFQLEDVNNMVPQFIDQISLSEIELPENTPKGTQVLKLFAVDTDPTPEFSQVTYSLVATTDASYFAIEKDAIVTQTSLLDYERKKNFVLKVKVEDGAPSSFPENQGRPNSAELPLTVHLLDQNDNMPSFTQSAFAFETTEVSPVATVVGKVTATDADETSILTFVIEGISPDFAINSVTGEVLVARQLSSLAHGTHKYTVVVNDGQFETSASLTINVTPMNQRLPKFSKNLYTYEVTELTIVDLPNPPSAVDPNDNPEILYSVGGYFSKFFWIDATTGALKITKGIPRDRPDGFPTCNVSVVATNKIGASYAQVQINLKDINNEHPRWPYPNQLVFCPENTPVNVKCATLVAPDADDALNAQSTYRAITSNENFLITELGDLLALQQLDYETLSESKFYIPIVATNTQNPASGGKLYSVSGTLTVSVVDVNDAPPSIVGGPSFEITIPERAPIGVDVFSIFINDPDTSDFGRHSCVMSPANKYFDTVYRPDIEACGIRPLVKLNVDDTPPIPPAPQKLDIIVFDSGNLHNTQASVTVTVVEANDNSPVIQIRPSSGPGEIYDGTPSLQMLVEIQVLVVDDGNEGYSFNLDSKSSADGVFGMNVVGPSTARLQLISLLKRDTLLDLLSNPATSPTPNPILPSATDGRVRWPLVITVNDQRIPVLTTTTTRTLTIVTRGPEIPANQLEGYMVPDNSPADTLVVPGSIQANDLDQPSQNNKINYAISPQSSQALKLFKLANQVDGKFDLQLRTTLNREAEGTATFEVPIIATLQQATRTATSTLTVTVTTNDPPPPHNGLATMDVYVPSSIWNWPYVDAVPNLPVAYMPDVEKYPPDRSNRIFDFTPKNENDLLFTLLTASPSGESLVEAKISTRHLPHLQNATSILNLRVNWFPGSGLVNGLLVRINHAKLQWFISSNDVHPNLPTPRERLRAALATQLAVPASQIVIFPVGTVGTSFDFFIGIQASPYEVPGRLASTFLYDSDVYDAALRGPDTSLPVALAATVSGSPGPVVIHCDSEPTSLPACEGRGCRSRLHVPYPTALADSGIPVTIDNSGLLPIRPGNGVIGPLVQTNVDCWCNGGDPLPPARGPIKCTDADACLNDGFCSEEPGTDSIVCDCPFGFTGPRCEQTQIFFHAPDTNYGWAPAIGGCTQLHLAFSFLAQPISGRPGLLLYAGPVNQSVGDVRTFDFIGLQIESDDQQLRLAYNLGSASSVSAVFATHTRLDDAKWHTIDLILYQDLTHARVTVMLDSCRSSNSLTQENGLASPPNLGDCLFDLPYSGGTQRALNVGQWPLQLGGRSISTGLALYPAELTTNSLPPGSGIKNVVVNGELWNLAQFGVGQGVRSAPNICLDQNGRDKCAPNGACSEVDSRASCTCRAGFQAEGTGCVPSRFSVELGDAPSYLELTTTSELLSQSHTEVTFSFRTRSANGTLVYLSGTPPNFYHNSSFDIRLENTRLEVIVNLGNFDLLKVSPARTQLNDGAWHGVRIYRSLSALGVEIDAAAGPGLGAFLPLNPLSNFFKLTVGKTILVGARRDFVPGLLPLAEGEVRPSSSSIGATCFRDLRINGAWYPLTESEKTAAGAAGMVVSIASFGKNKDSCSPPTPCPTDAHCSGNLICLPTWKPASAYMCSCPPGCVSGGKDGTRCFCLAVCSRFPCQNGGTCRPSRVDKRGFLCTCPPTHFGLLCEAEVMQAGFSVGAFIGIVIAVLVFVGLIIGVVIWRCHRKRAPHQLSPDKDLREHVVPYCEQADEIDVHSFDANKLAPTPVERPIPWERIPTFMFDLLESTFSGLFYY